MSRKVSNIKNRNVLFSHLRKLPVLVLFIQVAPPPSFHLNRKAGENYSQPNPLDYREGARKFNRGGKKFQNPQPREKSGEKRRSQVRASWSCSVENQGSKCKRHGSITLFEASINIG